MSDYLWLAAIVLGIVLVITGAQYIYIKAIKGEYEHDKTSYNKFFSFNKELDAKMEYFYNKNVTWLKIYMNFVLPFFALVFIWGLVRNIMETDNPYHYMLFVKLGMIILLTLDVFMIRDIDKPGFVLNIVSNVVFLFYLLFASGNIGAALIIFIIYGSVIALNIFYFIKRRELFLKSAKQLKKDYNIDYD